MPEKIKITKSEIEELYDVEDDKVEKVVEEQAETEANASFEVYTENQDKKWVKDNAS